MKAKITLMLCVLFFFTTQSNAIQRENTLLFPGEKPYAYAVSTTITRPTRGYQTRAWVETQSTEGKITYRYYYQITNRSTVPILFQWAFTDLAVELEDVRRTNGEFVSTKPVLVHLAPSESRTFSFLSTQGPAYHHNDAGQPVWAQAVSCTLNLYLKNDEDVWRLEMVSGSSGYLPKYWYEHRGYNCEALSSFREWREDIE